MIKTAFIAAASLTLVAAPAFAKDGSWQVGTDQMHLVYSDINPTTPVGRAALYARVEQAATKLCADEKVLSEQRGCIHEIVARTAAEPRNNALHLAMVERLGVPGAAHGGVAYAAR